ncbi:hypothetical protein LCGC14_0970100 [marine sediment metagenome]|uniref:Uncharacterized protein n=1 Tax=marine sediment metagenome TaxID=412755 RepID=A0A0F9NY15_9ZZZZ
MNEKLILENQHAIMKALALIDKGEISQKDYELLKNQIVETEDYLSPKEEPSLTDKTRKALEEKGICPDCNGEIKIRNPTGKCDHLYYPEYKQDALRGKSE